MVRYTIWTREAFKRGAKKSKGKNLMIPYYYRKPYIKGKKSCRFRPVKGGFYDPKELARGAKIELEHVYDDYTARIIAKHHLDEDRNYYKKLLKYVEPRMVLETKTSLVPRRKSK